MLNKTQIQNRIDGFQKRKLDAQVAVTKLEESIAIFDNTIAELTEAKATAPDAPQFPNA